jgi:hypothetical protein
LKGVIARRADPVELRFDLVAALARRKISASGSSRKVFSFMVVFASMI